MSCVACDLELLGPLFLIAALILAPSLFLKIRAAHKSPSTVNQSKLRSMLVCEGKLLPLFVCEVFLLGIGSLGSWLGYDDTRIMSERRICEGNARTLSYAAIQYQQDNDERFPFAGHWGDLVSPYLQKASNSVSSGNTPVDLKHVFQCPAETSPFGYGFNKALNKKSLADVDDPTTTILIFEADAHNRNFSGGRADLPTPTRHQGWDTFAFVDGHQRQQNPRSPDFRWLDFADANPPKK